MEISSETASNCAIDTLHELTEMNREAGFAEEQANTSFGDQICLNRSTLPGETPKEELLESLIRLLTIRKIALKSMLQVWRAIGHENICQKIERDLKAVEDKLLMHTRVKDSEDISFKRLMGAYYQGLFERMAQ